MTIPPEWRRFPDGIERAVWRDSFGEFIYVNGKKTRPAKLNEALAQEKMREDRLKKILKQS